MNIYNFGQIEESSEPYGFYIKNKEKFDNFLKCDKTLKYEKNLTNEALHQEKSNTNFNDKEELIKIPLNTLLNVEKTLIEDIKKDNPDCNFKKPSVDYCNNINKLRQVANKYANDFNNYFSQFYFGREEKFLNTDNEVKIKGSKDSIRQELKEIVDEDDFDNEKNFAYLLFLISKAGGFTITQGEFYITNDDIVNLNKNMKEIQSLNTQLENNLQTTPINANNFEEFGKKLNEALREATGTAIKNICDNKQNKKNNKTQSLDTEDYKKQIDEFSKNYEMFKKYVVIPIQQEYLRAVKSKLSRSKKLIGKLEKILNNKEYWQKMHKKLIASGYELVKITYVSNKENKGYISRAFKGDYGEILTTYINKIVGIKTTSVGERSLNPTVMGKAKSGVDEIIKIKGHYYGIQDKEFNLINITGKTKGINTGLYSTKNLNIDNLSIKEAVQLLSVQQIEILTSLIELYDEDKTYINAVLSQADLGQIRAATYEGMKNRALQKIKEKDILYSPIFKISGYFYPASAILAQRYADILEKSKVLNNTNIIRDFYTVKEINDTGRNNVVGQSTKKIHKIKETEIENILKLISISALSI